MDGNESAYIDTVDRWIKTTAIYGLAFVFLACVLLIILWVAVKLVRIFTDVIPRWFESSIASHQQIAKAVERQSELMDRIHNNTHTSRECLGHSLEGLRTYVYRNKDRLGLGSDVIVHLDNAAEAVEPDRHNGRYYEHVKSEQQRGDTSKEQSDKV